MHPANDLLNQASVNHERVGEEFATALREIDDIVRSVKQELSLYPNVVSIGLSVELCGYIIEFVAFPLRWYTQKRRKAFFASFNDNLSDQYQNRITEIRRLSEHIKRDMYLRSAADMKDVSRMMPEIYSHLREQTMLYQRFVSWAEEQSDMYTKLTEQQSRMLVETPEDTLAKLSDMVVARINDGVGKYVKQILHTEAQQFVASRNGMMMSDKVRSEDSGAPAIARTTGQSSHPPGPEERFRKRAEVIAASKALDIYFDIGQIDPDVSHEMEFVEGDAAQRLQVWTSRTASSILAILGPMAVSDEDTARLLTSNFVRAAKEAGIPCVSYFCATTHRPPPKPRTRETVGLTQLMYGLLKQLVIHLPAELPSDPVISLRRFEDLDGTLRTWPQALALFADLISATATPYLLIAIHGLEQIEDKTTVPRLRLLMRDLRQLVTDQGGSVGPKLKVLFATSGMSEVLGEELDDEEICDISRGGAARRPGQSGPGRQRISTVGL